MALRIRMDDTVVVISGDDAGAKGKVLRVMPSKAKVLVEGVNRVYKHVRRSQKNPQGGRLSKEMPIPIANVLLFCAKCNRGVRIGSRVNSDGSKERVCRKCGASMGRAAPAKAARAKKTTVKK